MVSKEQAEPTFLSRENILKIHERAIFLNEAQSAKPYGDTLWIRHDVLLESALFAPQATFGGEFLFKSLAEMAGAYWHSFVVHHSFEDGNKRVALAARSIFLNINGFC